MYPCSSCHRHVRETEPSCPFCGAEQAHVGSAATSLGTLALVAMLGTAACASRPGQSDEGNTTTTAGETATSTTDTGTETTDPTSTSTNGDGDGDFTDDSNSVSVSFYACSDPFDWGLSECDPWAQDCPDGEKCVPYASTGEVFDANKCVPVTGDAQAGEACVYGGIVEGSDDCDASSHCFDVNEMGEGVCKPFCGGTPDDPICAEGTECLIGWDGSVTLCIQSCNPLLQDCADGQMCTWTLSFFGCIAEAPAAPALGEPCSDAQLPTPDSCGLGNICIDAGVLAACDGVNCCTEYCDLDDPNFVCSDPNHACVMFYEPDSVPVGLENVGVCVLPPP